MTEVLLTEYPPPAERLLSTKDNPTCISFVGPYRPIMCGIGDYTEFITRRMARDEWAVLSFDLETYGAPLTDCLVAPTDPVFHGIPGNNRFSSTVLKDGLRRIRRNLDKSVLWFQHEFGIWPDDQRFVAMLKDLTQPKIVTLHTLHFQSPETPTGLRLCEYEFLRDLLPHVDAITVFSRGVYKAVTTALPAFRHKVFVLKHGIHSYPEASRLTRKEAKEKLYDYLLHEAGLPEATKQALYRQRILLDQDIVVVGQTGFLSPAKGSELLYVIGRELRKELPSKRIATLRIGSPRDNIQKEYAENIDHDIDHVNEFLVQALLPLSLLPIAQRAFDINFYWPNDCTQSGILAHALGAGATIAGRDMEGVGETFKDAGAVTTTDLHQLVLEMEQLILCPELAELASDNALKYAAEYSWDNQARRHSVLAEITKGNDGPFMKAAYTMGPSAPLTYASIN